MKKTKLILITVIITSGFLFAAIIHSSSAMALSYSSSNNQVSSSSSNDQVAGSSDAVGNPTSGSGSGVNQPVADTDSGTNGDGNQNEPCDQTGSTDPSSDGSNANLINTTTVNNCVNADAQSGDSSVTDSTVGGNATTGDASDSADVVNSVGSSGNIANGELDTETQNINGNVDGNVTVDPTSTGDPASLGTTPVTVNTSNSNTVNNTVNLTADSGNADVSNNQTGGNATSGSATTEADVVNLLNSAVDSGQSFIYTININGTLDGNIVIPEQLIAGLLSGPSDGSVTIPASTLDDASNTSDINNAVELNSASGDATVSDNQVGGNATTGSATTLLNVYNFVNSDITGGNVLLVFVNVMGTWVGMLLNEPVGTTTAALGGQIQQDASTLPETADSSNTDTINNNIDLNSESGNATVSYNDLGGNATTGNATSIANLVNIINSDINLTGWLGILIINVYGTWDGSLIIQATSDPVTSSIISNNQIDPASINPADPTYTIFNPTVFIEYATSSVDPTSIATTNNTVTTKVRTISYIKGNNPSDPKTNGLINYLIGGIVFLVGISILGTERYLSRRQQA